MKVQQKIVVAVLLISSAMNLMARQLYTKNSMKATRGSGRSYKGAIANKEINMMTPAEIVKLKYNDLNAGQRSTLWFVAIYSGLGIQRRAAQQVINATQTKPLNWSQLQADAQSKGLDYVIASHTPLPADEEEATSSSADSSLLDVSGKPLTSGTIVDGSGKPFIHTNLLTPETTKKGNQEQEDDGFNDDDELASGNDNQQRQFTDKDSNSDQVGNLD